MEDLIKRITENDIYKKVLDESFGGIMFNKADYGKYDYSELIKLFEELEKERYELDGIMLGVKSFILGKMN